MHPNSGFRARPASARFADVTGAHALPKHEDFRVQVLKATNLDTHVVEHLQSANVA
jgi:hypothetical protein